jgi:hypothetical protein
MGPPEANPGLNNNSAQSGGFPWGAAAAGVGAIGAYFGGQATNDANSAEAAANRQFAHQEAENAKYYDATKTEWTSKHQYQNAVGDMRAAGLNPAMMYAKGGGGEMGSGSSIQASAAGNPVHTNALGQGLNSGMAAASLMNDIKNTNADVTAKQAQAINSTANAALSNSSARQVDEETAQLAQRRGANKANAILKEGDDGWSDRNRSIRMLTTKAGIGSAIVNSADAAGKMFLGEGDTSLIDRKLQDYRENKALNKAGKAGLGQEHYGRRGFND